MKLVIGPLLFTLVQGTTLRGAEQPFFGNVGTFSDWFSEEGEGGTGVFANPISGVDCDEKHCDNKRVFTTGLNEDRVFSTDGNVQYTEYISEEGPGQADCPTRTLVCQVKCKGRYCDELKLGCCATSSNYTLQDDDIQYTEFYSEDEGLRNCNDGYFMSGIRCKDSFCGKIQLKCTKLETSLKLPQPLDQAALAAKFAPRLYFDSDQKQFPMLNRDFWDNSVFDANGDRVLKSFQPTNEFNTSKMAQHYQVNQCNSGGRVVITYWTFYHYQPPCWANQGSHHGDWERISVHLTADKQAIAYVRYYQHGGWYTRLPGSFEIIDGTHPAIFTGQKSKGSYHNSKKTDSVSATKCMYWNDRRDGTSFYNSWDQGHLVPAITSDAWNQFTGKWGKDGITGPITRTLDYCYIKKCKGSSTFGTDGCARTQSP
mmetsp:Transcript_14941/g.24337  ORF Transcript_14941/g.24337 Transcript_14941/m.24337 type:complete len:427 (-) Transcript_14941:157-1437(-)|eukprot:CAMPEP_0203748228 /NCGR_PEP_ID=MMETSP0098-20131031/3163_1 /ASSEMBLY_ACC=CAM_ASM_000208 /TAXON_ID=96639 /ORGANISM=" , Strain NY0313808BC1" /LENGTH=426 /DNA_ID=CAMNT_0050636895 /DNA_START=716 /DNA_END=1996 /DNA_ORIENTATION=-